MRFYKVGVAFLCMLLLFPTFAGAASPDFKIGDKNWKITLVQRALQEFSYSVDRTDGVFTKKTVSALKKFQKTNKLQVTGNIDDNTYKLLMDMQKKRQKPGNDLPGKASADKLIVTASKYKGVPYKFGGTTPKGFDCSGYTAYVFKEHKITLPRMVDDQYKLGQKIIKNKQLAKGDLVFFSTYEKGPSHVGIYAGNNSFWHSSTSRGIMLSRMDDSYWKPRYLGARRVLQN